MIRKDHVTVPELEKLCPVQYNVGQNYHVSNLENFICNI